MVDSVNTNIHIPRKNETISEPNKGIIFSHNALRMPQQDTVEISSKQKKTPKLKKWHKIAIAIGTTCLLGLGLALCFKKVNPKKIQKTTQKTKELAKQTVTQAKTSKPAEPNTGSKALEVQEKLKTEADKIVHNKASEKLVSDFEKKAGLNTIQDYMWSSESKSLETYSQEIIKALKTAEEKTPNLPELEELYKSLIKSDQRTPEQIKAIIEEMSIPGINFQFQHTLLDRTNFIADIEKLKEANPIKQGEKFSDYMQRLFNLRKERVSTIERKHLEAIKSKLVYAPDKPVKIELTDKELETIRKWRPEYKDLTKEQALKELSKCRSSWTQGYTSEGTDGGLPDEIEQILLEKVFPRYNSTTAKQFEYVKDKGTIHPVARWMNVSGTPVCKDGNVDKYIEETFKVGETYTAPMRQSCSMSLKSAGDACFSDNFANEVKMIIHPHSSASKAADISQFADASCKYGFLEVIYPKGTKFNVLDKRLEICKAKDGSTYHRWLVELQEC